MKLFFQNSKGEERVIAEPSNREDVIKEINKFLDDYNYKSYYTRVWERMTDWCSMLDHIQNSSY